MLSILTSLKPLIENKYDINCKWINVKVRFISFVFVWLGLSPRHLCSYITHTMRATQTSIGHAENTLKLEESVRERRRDTHEERGLFWETVVRLNSIPPVFFASTMTVVQTIFLRTHKPLRTKMADDETKNVEKSWMIDTRLLERNSCQCLFMCSI